jgi:hypothetical protein
VHLHKQFNVVPFSNVFVYVQSTDLPSPHFAPATALILKPLSDGRLPSAAPIHICLPSHLHLWQAAADLSQAALKSYPQLLSVHAAIGTHRGPIVVDGFLSFHVPVQESAANEIPTVPIINVTTVAAPPIQLMKDFLEQKTCSLLVNTIFLPSFLWSE